MRKLGLIAGGGRLPFALAERCAAAGRPFFILRLKGFAERGLDAWRGADVGLAELGRALELLRREGCEAICFAGLVKRPDLAALKPDWRGVQALPAAMLAARRGDDALLRFLIGEFEREGFTVEGADAVDAGLTLPLGPLGAHAPCEAVQADIAQAVRAARAIGELDIGQSVVVVDGIVLAVEAQEGTDAMLARCSGLPQALRGMAGSRKGVLVKWPKPIQERRVDLPTIGAATIARAAEAGLVGVAGEAGAVLVLEREAVIAAADRLGLFVAGLPAS